MVNIEDFGRGAQGEAKTVVFWSRGGKRVSAKRRAGETSDPLLMSGRELVVDKPLQLRGEKSMKNGRKRKGVAFESQQAEKNVQKEKA